MHFAHGCWLRMLNVTGAAVSTGGFSYFWSCYGVILAVLRSSYFAVSPSAIPCSPAFSSSPLTFVTTTAFSFSSNYANDDILFKSSLIIPTFSSTTFCTSLSSANIYKAAWWAESFVIKLLLTSARLWTSYDGLFITAFAATMSRSDSSDLRSASVSSYSILTPESMLSKSSGVA